MHWIILLNSRSKPKNTLTVFAHFLISIVLLLVTRPAGRDFTDWPPEDRPAQTWGSIICVDTSDPRHGVNGCLVHGLLHEPRLNPI